MHCPLSFRSPIRACFQLLAVTCLTLAFSGEAARAATTLLYSFKNGGTGDHPWSTLIAGPDGSLFGTTADGGPDDEGAAFQLTPPAAGETAWKYTVLHEFTGGNDGAEPLAGLFRGPDGTLYGTTHSGGGGECSGGCGTVYQLAPISGGRYRYSIIYRFRSVKSGVRSYAQLTMDSAGVLYGTTAAGGAYDMGTVFALRKQDTRWAASIIHSFQGGLNDGQFPQAGVVFGPDGALYGTTLVGGAATGSRGTVFRLALSGGGWASSLIYRFKGGNDGEQPLAPVAFDSRGVLYGTTSLGGGGSCFLGCGTIFRLAGSGTSWKGKVVYAFQHGNDGSFPRAGVTVDRSNVVWGTTTKGGAGPAVGVIFMLKHVSSGWRERVMHTFAGPPTDGAVPFGGLHYDRAKHRFFGTTRDGGAAPGGGGSVYLFEP